MNRASNTVTMTANDKKVLEYKAKQGWRCYFIMRDDFDSLSGFVYDLRHSNSVLRQRLQDGEDIDIEFLKKQYIEMYDKLKEYTECPVCLETLTKDNIEVPKCGHTICKSCIQAIKSSMDPKCPNCRKKY